MAGPAGDRAATGAYRLPGGIAVRRHRLPGLHPDADRRAMRAVELSETHRFAAAVDAARAAHAAAAERLAGGVGLSRPGRGIGQLPASHRSQDDARDRKAMMRLVDELAATAVVDFGVNIRNKLTTGKFTVVFLIQCPEAIETKEIRL